MIARRLVAASALALSLTACANTQEAAQPSTSAETSAATTDAPAKLQVLTLGSRIAITQCGDDPCDIEVTFTEAALTETCPFGVKYPDMEGTDPEGTQYLTLDGEFNVRDSPRAFALNESDFTAVDSEDYATTSLTAFDCEDLDPDNKLTTAVDPGLKRSGHIILAIPENTELVRFSAGSDPNTHVFDVSSIEIQQGAGERPAAPSETVPPDTPQANAPIWNEPGIGYRCAATDAWTNDPANCTAANLGGDPAYDNLWGPAAAIPAGEETPQDLSNAPYADGGTCAAAICGYGTNDQGQHNPTSGEIQTLHGCQDGYITDPELCAAVAWVETHQY
ncbi:hypothetical protein [Corynebacterium suedekumii]|uniref:Secreted protein n=1 Tax=Corynebacterium suedekumii TaxID=3049801 RepID=A0ABY8VKU5_9CORY|nr:hypothetical protein [Corynebacterium suedekumii]WIM70184.1 hypothetical protein QP029_13560 [Corynebacterium suedekumii]